jgi:hypothetical protein
MKTNDNFKIISDGDLLEGFDVNLVKLRLGRKFGLAKEQVDRLIMRNRHVLGDSFDFQCASNMKDAIECLGLKVRIECYSPPGRSVDHRVKLKPSVAKIDAKKALQ